MISKIVAVGFKGLEFTYDLKQHNLVVGPNGVGKSAISDAITLTVNGRIPGAGKTNQAVMDAFASNDKMFVGVGIDEAIFERRFIRNGKGKVTQKFQAGNSLVSKETFISDFSVAGKPIIIDLSAFLKLSDQKKIDKVFELYPPQGDVMGLHDQIEKATGDLNELTATIQKTEGIIQKLTADRAEIELPAGTLAEVTREIERTTAEVKLARKNLTAAQKREIEAEVKEKTEKAAAENAKIEKENLARSEDDPGDPPSANRPQLGGRPDHTARNSEEFQSTVPLEFKQGKIINSEPITKDNHLRASINTIIATMEKAGCVSCAAMLVAKRELQKY